MKLIVPILLGALGLFCFDVQAQSIEIVHKSLISFEISDTAYVEPVIAEHPENTDHIVVASIPMPVDNPDDFWIAGVRRYFIRFISLKRNSLSSNLYQ